MPTTPPGPKGYPLLGVLPQMRRDPLRLLTDAAREYGEVVLLRMGPARAYLLSHPAHIEHVLQDNHRNYRKSRFVEKVKPFLGDGLATSEGDVWRAQRRLAQPAFHRQRIAALATTVTETVAEMLERWRSPATEGRPVDVLEEMMALTGEVILRTMFGASSREVGRPLLEDFGTVAEHCMERMLAMPDWHGWFPTGKRRRFRLALRRLDEAVRGIITSRRRTGEDRGDLLSLLLAARDGEAGPGMTDRQLRDQVMTIFFAGHETTGLALTWTWYLVSQHPAVEQRLREELDHVLKGGRPGYDDVPRLVYTRMIIEEAMRLYPPSWIISRAPVADDEVGGYRIRAGSTVLLSQYVTHRHPRFWNEPDAFDPDRFAPDRAPDRPRCAYFPFSGGPRQCLGDQFAMMEAQLVVAMVAQAYGLRLRRGHRIEPQPLLTLRPRKGPMMTLDPGARS